MTVKRYEWLDALVEAQAVGIISNGELLTATKLSHAIRWAPKDGRPSGLYWANDLATEVVGLSRSTFYDNIIKLEEHGFVVSVKGNWLPAIPSEHVGAKAEFEVRRESIKAKYEEAQTRKRRRPLKSESRTDEDEALKSESRTVKSGSRTVKSGSRTSKSEFQHPYSVDTYTVDTYTVDKVSEKTEPAADAPVSDTSSLVSNKKEPVESVEPSLVSSREPSFASFGDTAAETSLVEEMGRPGDVDYKELANALPEQIQRDTFARLTGNKTKTPKAAYEHVTAPGFLEDDWCVTTRATTPDLEWI